MHRDENELMQKLSYTLQRVDEEIDKRLEREEPIDTTALQKRIRRAIRMKSLRYRLLSGMEAAWSVYKSALAVLSLVLIIAGITVSTVEAARKPFLEWMSEVTNISLRDDNQLKQPEAVKLLPEEWKGSYIPYYVPDGYKLRSHVSSQIIMTLEYVNDEGESILVKQTIIGSGAISLDNEEAQVEQTKISGYPATFVIKNEKSICWENDDKVILITANIALTDLIKIAESFRIIE